jgi:diadenylate cyclase
VNNALDIVESFLRDYFNISIPIINITDVLEIIIIAVFLFELFKWMRSTRAWMLIRGVLIILLFFVIAAFLQMNTILWIGEKLLSAGIIAFVVVFQPELRKALEQLGRRNFFRKVLPSAWTKGELLRFEDSTKNDIVKATYDMGRVKTGALIVIEQDVVLKEYERTGIVLDARLTRQLLINIFEKNTPLHDGAIIVRGDRVVAATCYLPLTESLGLSKELGTRHRAAVGISEVSDAITIVVSEETGKVSVTQDGKLYHDLDREELLEILSKAQIIKEEHDKKKEESSEMDTLEELGITKREDSNVE